MALLARHKIIEERKEMLEQKNTLHQVCFCPANNVWFSSADSRRLRSRSRERRWSVRRLRRL